MNEEEAKVKLKARLDGWKSYLGEKTSVSGIVDQSSLSVSSAAPQAQAIPLETRSVEPDSRYASDSAISAVDGKPASASFVGDKNDAFIASAPVTALKEPFAQESEASLSPTQTMPAGQQTANVPLPAASSWTLAEIGVGGQADYLAPHQSHAPRKGAVFLGISVLSLAGFCVLFLYMLFGK